jgi:hypothetical protein
MNGRIILTENTNSAFLPVSLNEGIYITKLYNYQTNTIKTSKIIVR